MHHVYMLSCMNIFCTLYIQIRKFEKDQNEIYSIFKLLIMMVSVNLKVNSFVMITDSRWKSISESS